MDASVHPIVTRGIEVSEMLSDALYKEDWNMERDLIYYPVNVTPMYETMKNNKTFQSDLIYREKYHEEKFKNTFNQCDTAKYADDHKIKVRYFENHYLYVGVETLQLDSWKLDTTSGQNLWPLMTFSDLL